MSDAPEGPGWWQAQDGRWYGPEHHPDPAHRASYGADDAGGGDRPAVGGDDPTTVAPRPGDDPTTVAPVAGGGGAGTGEGPPPGWWQAQDGQWYGPEHHPDPAHRAAYAGGATPPPGALPPSGAPSDPDGRSKLPLVIGAVVVIALLVVGAIVVFGGDDDDDGLAAGDTTTTTDGDATTTTGDATTTTGDVTTTTGRDATTTTVVSAGDHDVEVVLRWSGDADLDLRVTDGDGEVISFSSSSSTSSGELEEDVVPGFGDDGDHEERIWWPDGDAPAGTYTVEVSSLDSDPTDFEVVAVVDGDEVLDETGTIDMTSFGEEFSFEVG